MVWPTQLVFDEDGWVLAHSLAEVGWAGRGVLLLAIVTLPTFWRWPRIGFAGVWFFLVLAPTSSFVPILTEIAAEHRMYLPMVGWISLAVIGGWGLARRWFLSRVLAGVLCVTIVATLAVLTFQRNAQFQTAESIWLDTISKRPNNGRAHYSLACVLSDEAHQFPEGSPRFVALSAEAAEEFRVALRSYRSFDAEIKEAAAMTDAGNLAGAEAMYDHLIFARPDSTGGWNLLRGQVRVRRQEWTMARDDFQTLVQDRPNDPEAHYLLAVALQQLNDPKAAAEFQRTLELSPGYKDAELRLMKVK
jgi:hypothetical protein